MEEMRAETRLVESGVTLNSGLIDSHVGGSRSEYSYIYMDITIGAIEGSTFIFVWFDSLSDTGTCTSCSVGED